MLEGKVDDSIDMTGEEFIEISIEVGNKKGRIKTLKKYEDCIYLLKYCIENKLKDIYIKKEETIVNVLEGKGVNLRVIKENIPFLLESFYIVIIYSEDMKDEILELLKAGYSEYETVSLIYNNYIVMVGKLDDVEEHVISIKDSISSNLYSKCYIAYRKVDGIGALWEAFFKSMSNIELAIKYNLEEQIYGEKSLLFESIIDGIDDSVKKKLYKEFHRGLSKLDRDMTKTIEVFFQCGLNVSDASKELYVHRNTLIYRLDKIQKFTGYDIRNFNEAVIFKIAFFIWRSEQ
ncbi:MAG: PucR family transcriptional regulator [Sarcina sp.]